MDSISSVFFKGYSRVKKDDLENADFSQILFLVSLLSRRVAKLFFYEQFFFPPFFKLT